MSARDGGPAFPTAGVKYHNADGVPLDPYQGHGWLVDPVAGMSLRDYFAAKALQSLIANFDLSDLAEQVADIQARPVREVLSVKAYEFADAMLKARVHTGGL